MEINIVMLMTIGALLFGFITGFIINHESNYKNGYDLGYRNGYLDAIDEIEPNHDKCEE